MAISSKLKDQLNQISETGQKRLCKMAWDDGTSYKDIKKEYNLSPNEIEKFMRFYLSDKDFKRWRNRLAKRTHKKGKPVHRLYELQGQDDY